MGPSQEEEQHRKRVLGEKYKRDLITQMEEQRKMRLEEEPNKRLQLKFTRGLPAKTQEACVGILEDPQISETTTRNNWSKWNCSLFGRSQEEEQQRKFSSALEYKRDLLAQIEEQRRMGRKEEPSKRLQLKFTRRSPAKAQEVLVETSEEPQNVLTTKENDRSEQNCTFLGQSQEEEQKRKCYLQKEYKRDLLAQIAEQRQMQMEEEPKKRLQLKFTRGLPAKAQEVRVQMSEDPQTTVKTTLNDRSEQYCSLQGLSPEEEQQRKIALVEEYKRDLLAQIEEQRRMGRKEEPSKRLQLKFTRNLPAKAQEACLQTPEEPQTTVTTTQNKRSEQNCTFLGQSQEKEQKKKCYLQEYKRDLLAQIEEQRQMRLEEEPNKRLQLKFTWGLPAKTQEAHVQLSQEPQTTVTTTQNDRSKQNCTFLGQSQEEEQQKTFSLLEKDKVRVQMSEDPQTTVKTTLNDRSEQYCSLQGLSPEEELQRKIALVEEYKRDLLAQIEEQRQMRMKEEPSKRLQLKFTRNLPAKALQACLQTPEEPQTTVTTTQNKRSEQNCTFLGQNQEEEQKRKCYLQEYKRDLLAQIEEQRQMRLEEEPNKRLLLKFTWGLPAKTQEITTDRQSSMEFPQTQNCLLDPAELEQIQKNRIRDREHWRELELQIADHRQRLAEEQEAQRARELAEERAEERRLRREEEFERQKLQQEQKITTDRQSSMEFPQTQKYAHNFNCLLDPAELEQIQKNHIRDREHWRELELQIADHRQRLAEEQEAQRARELAEERAEERRLRREEEFERQKLQQEQKITTDRQSSMEFPQTQKYAHNFNCLLDPAELEQIQKNRNRDREHWRELELQIADHRQRLAEEQEAQRARELAEERAEERRLRREEEFERQKLQQEQKITTDRQSSMEFPQTQKYAHNFNCLLDPAELEQIQKNRNRDREHWRELELQIADHRQRLAEEQEAQRARELAEERAEERRLRREEEFERQKLQQEQKVTITPDSCHTEAASATAAHPPAGRDEVDQTCPSTSTLPNV